MFVLALTAAAALQTAPRVTQFPWQPPGAEVSELTLAGPRSAQMEQVSDHEMLVCPNDSRERQIEQERVKLPESVFGSGGGYSGEMLHCRLEGWGLIGPLLLHLARRSPDGTTQRNWMISLSSQAVQIGFAGVLEDRFDPATVSDSGVMQPPVAKAEAPGFVIVQYRDQGGDNGGAAGEFVQRLFDLRGDEPREIAVHTWTNYGERRCDFGPRGPGPSPRCRWDPSKNDFVCVEDDGMAKRTFLLIGQKPIPQDLGPAVPMETAKPGDRVRDLYLGIARFVAGLSTDVKLVFRDGLAFAVRKVAGGWAASDGSYPLKVDDVQTHEVSPIRVVAFPGRRGERFFDIVQDQSETLVRIGPSMERPGDSVSQLEMGSPLEQTTGACASKFEHQVLTAQPTAKGLELLYQDSFGGGSYAEDEEGGSVDVRCPRKVLITDDLDPSFSGSRIACERPMGPLVPVPRLGRLNLLWGNGIVEMGDWVTEYSLRGAGRGTLLLIDSGLPQGVWERLALGLPNNIEVLRVRVDLGRDLSMGFSKTQEIAMQAKAALGAVSARKVAVLAVGLTDEMLVDTLKPLSPAPAAITAINPVPTKSPAPSAASGFRVLVTDSADISRWATRGIKAAKISGLDTASLEKVILDITRELGWSEELQPTLRK